MEKEEKLYDENPLLQIFEHQNEILRQTQVELEASRLRYFNLFDLAPVGYVTVSETGIILTANLTATMLLRGTIIDRTEETMKDNKLQNQNIPNILIVDDVADNLTVLSDILKSKGYKVRPVLDGTLALQVAEKEKPDLILLDIMMPDVDGYEVCRRLKENQHLREIPVIFISALGETQNIVKAFACGGVDYITKPFQTAEVTARIATHVKICQQNKELIRINSEKDEFFSIISHDLRSPLSAFMQLTEMMTSETRQLSPEENKRLTLRMKNSSRSIYELLSNLLEWSRMQKGYVPYEPKQINVYELVTKSIESLTESIEKKTLELKIDIPIDLKIFADSYMIQTVLRNLISNAIKFTPRGGKILLSASQQENTRILISIQDTGIGMSKEMAETIFHLDSRNRRPGTDGETTSGLGLILCKEFAEKHGGTIWVESELEKGSTFKISIPAQKE